MHSRNSKEIQRTCIDRTSILDLRGDPRSELIEHNLEFTLQNKLLASYVFAHLGIGNYTRWLTKFRIPRLLQMKDVVFLKQCIIWFCHITWDKFYPLSPNCCLELRHKNQETNFIVIADQDHWIHYFEQKIICRLYATCDSRRILQDTRHNQSRTRRFWS